MAGGEVVEHHGLHPVRRQPFRHVAADVAGAAADEYAAGHRAVLRAGRWPDAGPVDGYGIGGIPWRGTRVLGAGLCRRALAGWRERSPMAHGAHTTEDRGPEKRSAAGTTVTVAPGPGASNPPPRAVEGASTGRVRALHAAPTGASRHLPSRAKQGQCVRVAEVASVPSGPRSAGWPIMSAMHDYERHSPPAAPRWRERLRQYLVLMRADRPIGWLLLLWPTWWALWLAADGLPPLWILFVFTAGVWLTRGAGCVVNDYADRWLDPHVKRTRERPLVTGRVSGREAKLLFAGLMLVAFALVLTLNALTIALSFIGLLLAATYPYLKRHTHLPQVYLGLSFGWGIPMAFAAVQGSVPRVAWVLYAANILWTTAYDTWYAMVDRDDDIRIGSKSTAILFGELDLVIQGVLYALFFLGMALVGRQAALGVWYWAGLGVAVLLVVWEFVLVRHRDRDACFRAFLHNHWVGTAIFAGIAVDLALH
ncbi:4-hydroxybenzoate octaprenyltransferase [Luteimonas yindakuii]|uniref:4-hydroxybenzoate octaprenyltransferase n=2 Tax=Luteimonas yindakuii TaxID=2565782 RepID=A0A4Z1R6Q1_9GAMM|nr:4-hydroxybenzoate octaprenyltransferase [Luteimonas yindakuii]